MSCELFSCNLSGVAAKVKMTLKLNDLVRFERSRVEMTKSGEKDLEPLFFIYCFLKLTISSLRQQKGIVNIRAEI